MGAGGGRTLEFGGGGDAFLLGKNNSLRSDIFFPGRKASPPPPANLSVCGPEFSKAGMRVRVRVVLPKVCGAMGEERKLFTGQPGMAGTGSSMRRRSN